MLLRRDAVLSKSLIPGEAQPRFRALPLHVSDLFGPQVKNLFREVSESARDSAFLRLPSPSPNQQGKGQESRNNSSGWKRYRSRKPSFPSSSASAPKQGRFSPGGRGQANGPSQ